MLTKIQVIVQSTPGWQELRKSLKGCWSPSQAHLWPTNITALLAFVRMCDDDNELKDRIICVRNYLHALRRGGIEFDGITYALECLERIEESRGIKNV